MTASYNPPSCQALSLSQFLSYLALYLLVPNWPGGGCGRGGIWEGTRTRRLGKSPGQAPRPKAKASKGARLQVFHDDDLGDFGQARDVCLAQPVALGCEGDERDLEGAKRGGSRSLSHHARGGAVRQHH